MELKLTQISPILLKFGFLVILIYSISAKKSFAQVQVPLLPGPGCLFNGKVYQKLIGTDNNGNPLFSGIEGNCVSDYSLPNPPWDPLTEGPNGSCTVWVDCVSNAKRALKKGKYGTVNVPLDDYATPLMLFVGSLVYFRFKNRLI